MGLFLTRIRVADMWMAHGRKDPADFQRAMNEGPELYRFIEGSRPSHVVEFRPSPSYLGVFIAAALPPDGRLITVPTDGQSYEPASYVPKAMKQTWTIWDPGKETTIPSVPDGSADLVLLEAVALESPWAEEAFRVVKEGGMISDGPKMFRIVTKKNPATVAQRMEWCGQE